MGTHSLPDADLLAEYEEHEIQVKLIVELMKPIRRCETEISGMIGILRALESK